MQIFLKGVNWTQGGISSRASNEAPTLPKFCRKHKHCLSLARIIFRIKLPYFNMAACATKAHTLFPLSKISALKINPRGSGCGSVGRAVAFDTRGPRFDSSHRQKFIEHLFIINCIEKTKINKKEAGNGPLFKNKSKKHSYEFSCKRSGTYDVKSTFGTDN